MLVRSLLAALVLAGALAVPRSVAAQEVSADCRAARQLLQRFAASSSDAPRLVPTGWTLPPFPWIAGLAPYPYPYIPTGWRLLTPAEQADTQRAQLTRALRGFADYTCSPPSDTVTADQYAQLVSLLGYLQGDVADAIEAPAREILATSEAPRVRELAAAILAAVATLRRGGAP
ncbi:MAG TPA: hypothetical protein VFE37_30440 [Chloroflexota bacterium]|nr:hypothetical protein [Chloroflexota bacterium]